MDKGRFRVGISMLGSYLRASHTVEPEQREPGLADEDQPAAHVLDIGMLEWDIDAQLGVHRRFAFEILLPVRTTIIGASFIDEAGDELPNLDSIHHRDETIAGIGDLSLGGRIGLVLPQDVPRWTLSLRTGLSFPTGKIQPDPFDLGENGESHQHMFFWLRDFRPHARLRHKRRVRQVGARRLDRRQGVAVREQIRLSRQHGRHRRRRSADGIWSEAMVVPAPTRGVLRDPGTVER